MPDASGSVDLSSLSKDEAEAVERLASERGGTEPPAAESNEPRRALTAFVVIVDLNGNPEPMAFNDPSLNLLTSATPDLIYGAVQTIAKDIAAMESAQATAEVMEQKALQMQQQMQEQMLQRQVAKNLRTEGR